MPALDIPELPEINSDEIYPLRLTLEDQCRLLQLLRRPMQARGSFPGPILSAFDAVNLPADPGVDSVIVDLDSLQMQTCFTLLADALLETGEVKDFDGIVQALHTAACNGTRVDGTYVRRVG